MAYDNHHANLGSIRGAVGSPRGGPRAQSPDATVRALVDGPKFKEAVAFIQSDHDRFVRELVALTEIPAPPFKEQVALAILLSVAGGR